VSDPVAWDLAQRVAVRVAGRESSGTPQTGSLQPDFEELTSLAEELVAQETGLSSLSGPARARVTDRAGWVQVNMAGFRRLLSPLAAKLEPRLGRSSSVMTQAARAVAGVQVGTILGWMSTRVLGQYDLLLTEEGRDEDQDIVYYVGPNVVGLEDRFGFPPREFRLWLALHEVTHRAQFTGVPWLKGHFLSLVEKAVNAVDPDPRRILDGLRRAAEDIWAGRNPLAEGGLLGVVAGPEERAILEQVQAFMSLLEGHGDVTMDRAGKGRIPNAEHFSEVLRERRRQASGAAKLFQQLIGLEAKLRQYEQGEQFIAAVEKVGGPELFSTVWRGPEWLPSLAEVRDPARWIERVRSQSNGTG
jgi:coenzyme F420 biosynthesis associated uncharacterized protein